MTPVKELWSLFIKLGIIGFGGPAAHIAMMRHEVVQRREWLTDTEFLEMVGVTNLIPGPNSTEMAMHIGDRQAGTKGLVVSGLSFIVPAVLIVGLISWLYAEYGTDPIIFDIRYGVLPVIIAIIAHAVFSLGRSSISSWRTALLPVLVAVAFLGGINELLLLAIAGITNMTMHVASRGRLNSLNILALLTGVVSSTRFELTSLALLFLKIGSVLYGSGYVLLAFLERELVSHRGLLSAEQLLDAIAIGQITPGPVFSTATFIGWQLHGAAGAAVATVAIFAPSFFFVAVLSRVLPWVKKHSLATAFINGVTSASLGLMAGVLIRLTDSALTDFVTWIIALLALLLLARTKINTVYLVMAGVAIGFIS